MINHMRSLRILIFFILISGMGIPNYGEKIGPLPEVLKPIYLTIDDTRVYIVEKNSTIHIYNFHNNQLNYFKTFGREGEGPGEFKRLKAIKMCNDYLEIPSYGKYAKYSKDGHLINEIKLPIRAHKNNIFKLGEKFLVKETKGMPGGFIWKIKLYSSGFKMLKEIGYKEVKHNSNGPNIIDDYFAVHVFQNKIYIVDSGQKTIVKIYDTDGNNLSKINLQVSPVKMNSDLQEKIEEEIKGEIPKGMWESIKNTVYYPPFTPGLDYFDVNRNGFAVRTFCHQKNNVKFLFFNPEGRVLKQRFLYDSGTISEAKPFFFKDGVYYYLKEKPEEEVWDLHTSKIF